MKKTKNFVLALSLLGAIACSETKTTVDYKIIPLPNEMALTSGNLTLTPGSKFQITMSDSTYARVANQLEEMLVQKYQLKPSSSEGIKIAFEKIASDNPEAYNLTIGKNEIKIEAGAPNGAFYAFQTLRQMLPDQTEYGKNKTACLSGVKISDSPRFAYRGTHLDVARHFVTTDSVKRFIDILAMHKINTFHWHLTEDQGWRLEIKKYPELTRVGANRARTVIGRNTPEYNNTPHGGYYTQDEVREIVKYASDRYITVIPEIDLPGHMLAALASYPELGCVGKNYKVAETWGIFDDVLCAGNPKTLPFIYDIFDEVLDLFPAQLIHIGGDECPKVRWEKCPKCQAKIKELGLKKDDKHSAEERLQSFITQSVEKYLNERGRSLLGWDEIMEGGLSETSTVMAWRGTNYAFEAAKMGNNAILTPGKYYYFDHYQTDDIANEPLAIGGCSMLDQVYKYEPVADSIPEAVKSHILGVQANVWSEYMPHFSQVEYMLLPRLAALAESGWSKSSAKNYDSFLNRLLALTGHYDDADYNYAKHIFDVQKVLRRDSVNHKLYAELSVVDGADIRYTTDGTEPTINSPRYTTPVDINQSMEFKAAAFRKGTPSRVSKQSFSFNKATLKPITLNTSANKEYAFNGAGLLNDGILGEMNYRTGRWIGFKADHLSATIDMLTPTDMSELSIGSLVITGDWIFGPALISVSVSDDGSEFKEIKQEKLTLPTAHISGIERHKMSFDPVKARYVKVEINNLKQMPEWHFGKGKPAFLFVDEISIL